MANLDIAVPELSAETRGQLRSLRDKTVLVRHELRRVVQGVDRTAQALRTESETDGHDDLRRFLTGVAGDVGSQVDRFSASLHGYEEGLRQRPSKLVVALFGRTMAGKSTLVETLIGGSGDRIGQGGQGTTKKTDYCDWGDVTLLDTPGIGAFQGEQDASIARRDVGEADLVIFMLTNDSIAEEIFRGFEHVRDENKPVLFVLNTKQDVSGTLLRKQFLRDPGHELGPEALRGHQERLDELVNQRLGITRYRVVPLHAQAAWIGASEPDEELLEASNLRAVVNAVTELITTDAVTLRIRSTFDPSILEVERVGQRLADLRDEMREQERIYAQRATALEGQLDQIAATHRNRVTSAVEAHLGAKRNELRPWLEAHIDEPDLADQFKAWLERGHLEDTLNQAVQSAVSQLDEVCEGALDRLELDLSCHFEEMAGLEHFDAVDWGKHLTRLRRTARILRVSYHGYRYLRGASAGNWITLALVALTEGLAFAAKRFPSINVPRRAYIALRERELNKNLQSLTGGAVEQACSPIEEAISEGEAGQLHQSLQHGAGTLGRVAELLNSGATSVRSTADTLSEALCAELLSGEAGVELWTRVPGQFTCLRHALAEESRQRLSEALCEEAVALEGTRTEVLRQLFGEEASLSWEPNRLNVRGPAEHRDLGARAQMAERIAERPVIVKTAEGSP